MQTAIQTKASKVTAMPRAFESDDRRWAAVQAREAAADGQFYFAVRTTGV